MVYTLRIEEAKQIILRNPGVICAVLKLQKNLKTFCKIIVRCGENVGKMLYKNGLQVSVGHLRVPGAGIEPARIAPLVFETSASTDSAIRAGVLCPKTGTRRIDLLVKECKGIGNFRNCKIKRSFCEHLPRKSRETVLDTNLSEGYLPRKPSKTVLGLYRLASVRCNAYGKMHAIPSITTVSGANHTRKCNRSPHQSLRQHQKDCYLCRL